MDFDGGQPLPEAAHAAQYEDQHDRAGKKRFGRAGNEPDSRFHLPLQRELVSLDGVIREPGRKRVFPIDFLQPAARIAETQQGQKRQHHSHRHEEPGDFRIPVAITQPEIKADASVDPDHDQCKALPCAADRIIDPQAADNRIITDVDAIEHVRYADIHGMADDQKRDRQAENDLKRFAKRHAQRSALIKRAQNKADMHDNRPIKKQAADGIEPDQAEPFSRPFGGIDGDEREGVIEKMGKYESKYDETG
ncbi:hypothetical protein D3C72_1339710 [compost metagenome]